VFFNSSHHGSPDRHTVVRDPVRFVVTDPDSSQNIGRQPPLFTNLSRTHKLFTRFITSKPHNFTAVQPQDEVFFHSSDTLQKAVLNRYIARRIDAATVFVYDDNDGMWVMRPGAAGRALKELPPTNTK
jgi:hypothetical protein